MVAGIDHDGHRLSGETPFMHLFAKEDFHDGIVDLLKRMERDASVYVEGKRAARRYADDHLGWTHSVDALHAAIEQRVDEVGPKEKVVPGFAGNPVPEPEPVVQGRLNRRSRLGRGGDASLKPAQQDATDFVVPLEHLRQHALAPESHEFTCSSLIDQPEGGNAACKG